MTAEEIAAQQDDLRTKRNFISLMGGFLNANDTSTAGQDAWASNGTSQYQTIGINGVVGVEGTSASNLNQPIIKMSPMMLLLIAGAAFFFLRK